MSELAEIPGRVADLVEMARHSVTRTVGVEPDLSPETLPVVDEYLRQLPRDAAPEVHDLVLTAVGCYFGEVVRRLLNGRWAVDSDDPGRWRVELVNCFLHFCPVGMTGEVALGRASDAHDGSFATLDELRDPLHEMLSEAAPLPEDEYYSLAGRVDVLQLVADWLMGRSLAAGHPPRIYTAEDYALRIGVAELDPEQ